MAAKTEPATILGDLCDKIKNTIEFIDKHPALPRQDIVAAYTAITKVVEIVKQLAGLVKSTTGCNFDKMLQDLHGIQDRRTKSNTTALANLINQDASDNSKFFEFYETEYKAMIRKMAYNTELADKRLVSKLTNDELVNELTNAFIRDIKWAASGWATFISETLGRNRPQIKQLYDEYNTLPVEESLETMCKTILSKQNESKIYLFLNLQKHITLTSKSGGRSVERVLLEAKAANYYYDEIKKLETTQEGKLRETLFLIPD